MKNFHPKKNFRKRNQKLIILILYCLVLVASDDHSEIDQKTKSKNGELHRSLNESYFGENYNGSNEL